MNAADIVFATATSGAVAERMRITSVGKVGINVTSPDHTLDIDAGTGKIQIRTVSDGGVLITENDADATGGLVLFQKSRGNYASPGDVVNADAIGGVGTSAWSGSSYFATAKIDFAIDGTYTSNTRPPSRMTFSTNTANAAVAERMRITAAGAVGIGTAAPVSPLTVIGITRLSRADATPAGTASTVYDDCVLGSTDTANTGMTIFGTGQGGIAFGDAGSNSAGQIRYQHPTDKMEFIVADSVTAMTIGSAGNLGIGMAASASVPVVIAQDGNNEVVFRLYNDHANPYGFIVGFSAAAPDDNTKYFSYFMDNSTLRAVCYSDGDWLNHDGTYGTISDLNLKKDITPANSQWDDVKMLGASAINYRSIHGAADSRVFLGWGAQNLQAAGMDGLVMECGEGDDAFLGVRTSVLHTKAVIALSEAMVRIESLEAAVSELQAA